MLERGQIGESYNIGAEDEKTNLDVVEKICDLMDELYPRQEGSYRELIAFVEDRPGHDLRYAIDPTKINRELGWKPQEKYELALRKTVQWYLANPHWGVADTDGYEGERLGLGP